MVVKTNTSAPIGVVLSALLANYDRQTDRQTESKDVTLPIIIYKESKIIIK